MDPSGQAKHHHLESPHQRYIMRSIAGLVLAAAVSSTLAFSDPTPLPHGISVDVNGDTVDLEVFGTSAFRLGVGRNGHDDSLFVVEPESFASFKQVQNGSFVGISTSFGSLQIDAQSAAFQMLDAAGNVLTSATNLFPSSKGVAPAKDVSSSTCDNPKQGTDAQNPVRVDGGGAYSGQTQASCCAMCDKNSECTAWVYATSDPAQNDNCWLLKSSTGTFSAGDRVFGGSVVPPPPPPGRSIALDHDQDALFFGSGTDEGSAAQLVRTSGQASVGNTVIHTPYYWSSTGYSALGLRQSSWQQQQQGSQQQINWQYVTDMYLMPAATVDDASAAFFDLTGTPPVPPRYATGFFACRWGWDHEDYIFQILDQFRNGSYPIDSIISDFSWFTNESDYSFPPTGESFYEDFGYNAATYPNPQQEYERMHSQYDILFGGIRKPRLGNSQLLQLAYQNGWTLGQTDRNLNYSMEALRDWYTQQQLHYHKDGVTFYWNDEGETELFTFYWWNVAQRETLKQYNDNLRFFSINRAFTPGMARLGASIWTGDVPASWDNLKGASGYALNYGMAGLPYVAYDTGGFAGQTTAPMLARWYWVAAMSPIMRVHSTHANVPHFPFLWPAEADAAMKLALELRYRLVPYIYSLGHRLHNEHRLLARPLLADFLSTDRSTAYISSQWLLGDGLMAAPCLNQDNSSNTYFPQGSGTWFEFNSTTTHEQGTNQTFQNMPLAQFPMYARAGTVIPFGPIVQSTRQLPGGDLEVHVYAGSDATFTMYEDDGETLDYSKSGSSAVKQTTFKWDDSSRTLSWDVTGSYDGPTNFKSGFARCFTAGQSAATVSATASLSTSGSVKC